MESHPVAIQAMGGYLPREGTKAECQQRLWLFGLPREGRNMARDYRNYPEKEEFIDLIAKKTTFA
jgi:hypothetical protein